MRVSPCLKKNHTMDGIRPHFTFYYKSPHVMREKSVWKRMLALFLGFIVTASSALKHTTNHHARQAVASPSLPPGILSPADRGIFEYPVVWYVRPNAGDVLAVIDEVLSNCEQDSLSGAPHSIHVRFMTEADEPLEATIPSSACPSRCCQLEKRNHEAEQRLRESLGGGANPPRQYISGKVFALSVQPTATSTQVSQARLAVLQKPQPPQKIIV